MTNKRSSLTYRWFEEVWNQGLEQSIDKFLDKNAVIHGIEGTSGPGPDGFKTFYWNFRNEFDNVHVEVESVLTEDNFEAARCIVELTHKASNINATLSGMTYLRVENDKIQESWNNFDFLGMYKQLGFKLSPQEEPIS